MSEIICYVKKSCEGIHKDFPDWTPCFSVNCPGFVLTEIELSVALRAVLKANPSLLREVRRDAVKPSEIL